jgi:hypothetical protein
VLAGIGGTAVATSAKAADDPVPTTTEPEPDPTPDPYKPARAPKPKPKPAPAPRSQPAPAPTPVVVQTPAAPAPTAVPSRAAVTRPVPKPTRKKTAHRNKVHKKEAKPIPEAPKTAQVAVQLKKTVAVVGPSEPFDYAMLVLLAMVGLASACLAVAAIPAPYLPWRPAAYFVARRSLDLAIVGMALLLLAGLAFVVTGGP